MTDPRTGAEMVVRSHQLKAKVNPIPKALRGMLGSDEFKVVVQAQWYRLRYSFEDAMSLTVRPPVMPDRIKIRGWQWAERVDDHNCNLCTKMEISVKIPAPGVGGQVEKGTANGMKGAYADQPRRVITYLAQRKAAGRPYDDPFVWEAERLAKEAKAKAESAMVAAPSMAKVNVLIEQLDLPESDPFVETVDKAVLELGLADELKGANIVQKLDACICNLSSRGMIGEEMAQPVIQEIQPEMITPETLHPLAAHSLEVERLRNQRMQRNQAPLTQDEVAGCYGILNIWLIFPGFSCAIIDRREGGNVGLFAGSVFGSCLLPIPLINRKASWPPAFHGYDRGEKHRPFRTCDNDERFHRCPCNVIRGPYPGRCRSQPGQSPLQNRLEYCTLCITEFRLIPC